MCPALLPDYTSITFFSGVDFALYLTNTGFGCGFASNHGVHFDKAFDLRLKQECQAKYEEVHTRDEFMSIIGRSYL